LPSIRITKSGRWASNKKRPAGKAGLEILRYLSETGATAFSALVFQHESTADETASARDAGTAYALSPDDPIFAEIQIVNEKAPLFFWTRKSVQMRENG
jgi:hypothetical protein